MENINKVPLSNEYYEAERAKVRDSYFPHPEQRTGPGIKRTYDVRVTINKSGKGKDTIRFGFINNAAAIFGIHPFIEVSDVTCTKNRIYFCIHDEKIHRNVHAISGIDKKESCYFTITPSEKAEKIYRMNWIGHTYKITFDKKLGWYYIENSKEEN